MNQKKERSGSRSDVWNGEKVPSRLRRVSGALGALQPSSTFGAVLRQATEGVEGLILSGP